MQSDYIPKSRESQVSDVSVCVTLVMSVQAESVDVLMVVSGMEADEVPITTSYAKNLITVYLKTNNRRD